MRFSRALAGVLLVALAMPAPANAEDSGTWTYVDEPGEATAEVAADQTLSVSASLTPIGVPSPPLWIQNRNRAAHAKAWVVGRHQEGVEPGTTWRVTAVIEVAQGARYPHAWFEQGPLPVGEGGSEVHVALDVDGFGCLPSGACGVAGSGMLSRAYLACGHQVCTTNCPTNPCTMVELSAEVRWLPHVISPWIEARVILMASAAVTPGLGVASAAGEVRLVSLTYAVV